MSYMNYSYKNSPYLYFILFSDNLIIERIKIEIRAVFVRLSVCIEGFGILTDYKECNNVCNAMYLYHFLKIS